MNRPVQAPYSSHREWVGRPLIVEPVKPEPTSMFCGVATYGYPRRRKQKGRIRRESTVGATRKRVGEDF